MQMHTIRGSGGGGKAGGGGGGITEDPDTLSGVTRGRYIDLIGEGRIDGLVNGEQSIYLDGVALRGVSGTPNYRPFRWSFTPGTPDQQPIPGFDGSSSEVTVSVELKKVTGRIIRAVPDADADAVRINVAVQGLSTTSDKGKISKAKVEFHIYGRRASGSWVLLKEVVIDGKTGARYPRSTEVMIAGLPGTGPFEIGVERVTDDSTSSLVIDSLYWDSYTIINYERFAYPNSALIGLEMDARYFSSIPSRSYHVRGLIVRVPSNYNPITRQYTGVWDGNFKLAYTNNPAWCYFDILTNPRYGLGRRIKDSMVNKWQLYEIARYCDEMVPTGLSLNISDIYSAPGVGSDGSTVVGVPQRLGPTEPRFTLNVVLNTADDAYRVISQLTSVFRGMSYWAASGVALTQDRPTASSMTWTNANVIDGQFNYQGTSRAQRFTVVSVGWNDPNEDFRQRFEYVEDRDGIQRYGVRPTDILAFGCTSRSQARRVGLWYLYTGRMETDAITFKAGLDSSQVSPGDVGQIQDFKRVGARWGGRVTTADANTVELDAPVTLTAGSYTLTTTDKEGKPVTRGVTISASGQYSSFTVGTPYAEPPSPTSIWVLNSTTVSPVWVRVVTVRQLDPATFEITVIKHNPSKYRAIDEGGKLEVPSQTLLKRGELPKVEGLVAVENTYRTVNSLTPISSIVMSWGLSDDLLVRGYNLRVTGAQGTVLNVDEQSTTTYTLDGVDPGVYTVTVRPISHLGQPGSQVTEAVVNVTGLDNKKPEDVRNFAVQILAGGAGFRWSRPAGDPSYLRTEIHIEPTWIDSTPSIFSGDAESFTWAWPGPGTYRALAKHVDTSGNRSQTAAAVNFVVDSNIKLDYSNVGGSTRPEDGATRNRVTRQPNDPGGQNGDIWHKTTPDGSAVITVYTRIGGAWSEDPKGESVTVEFSANGTSGWRSNYVLGDAWLRYVSSTGATTSAVRFVGEDGASGGYTDIRFTRAPASPPLAVPTGVSPAGYFDAPPADNGQPLWMTRATKDAAGALTSTWSVPVIITGKSASTSLINTETWVPGAATIGGYGKAQDPSENTIVLAPGPDGETKPLWRAVSSENGTSDLGDGGFETDPVNIDPTKMYRLSVWVFNQVGTSGFIGFATAPNSVMQAQNSGTVEANPYFAVSARTSVPSGQWLLLVGYIYPRNYSGGQLNSGGVYSGSDGQKITDLIDYKWVNAATQGTLRAYFYNANAGDTVFFGDPRFDLVNGLEPSLSSLLSVAINQRLSSISLNTDGSLNGAGGGMIQLDDLVGNLRVDHIADGLLAATKFASEIEPVTLVAVTPTYSALAGGFVLAIPKKTTAVQNEVDGKLYTWDTGVNLYVGDYNPAYHSTVVAGQVAAGAITAREIAAKAIRTENLLVTGESTAINADPKFRDTDQWSFVGGTGSGLITAATSGPAGEFMYRIAGYGIMRSKEFPLVAGSRYKVSAWLAKSVADGSVLAMRLITLDRAGAVLSYQVSNIANTGVLESVLVPTTFTRLVGYATVPTGAVKGMLEILANFNSGSVTFVQDFRCEERIDGSLVVDGSIEAKHMSVTQLSAITARFGLMTTRGPAGGSGVEIADDLIQVFYPDNSVAVEISV